MKSLHIYAFAALMAAGIPAVSSAEARKQYNFEFGLLASINHARIERVCYYEPWYCDGNETTTYAMLPGIAPAFRMTVWSDQPILFDLGVTFVSAIPDRGNVQIDVMFEGGIGYDFAKRADRFHPFVGAVGGYTALDDPLGHLGLQGGIRYFVRDHAALRVLIGYRETLESGPPKYRSIELACGLGFFL